jgi:hypothetical protein
MNTENFKEEFRDLEGTKVRITTYKIGDECYCHVYNADPGATIARATAGTVEEAMQKAIEKASSRLAGTVKKK